MEENLFPSVSMLSARSEVEEERRLFYVAVTRAKKAVALAFAGTRMRNGKHESNAPSRFLKEIDPQYISNPLDEEDFDNSGVTHEWGGFGSRFTGGRLNKFGAGNGAYGQSSGVRFERRSSGTARGAAGLPPERFGLRPHPSQADAWAPPVHEAPGGYASRGQSSAPRPGGPSGSGSPAGGARSLLADADFVGVPMTELVVGQRVEHNRFGPGTILELSGRAPEMKAKIRFDVHGEKLLLLKYAKLRPLKA